MIKLKDILTESRTFTNWRVPSNSDLKREYRVEHEMKGLGYFDTEQDFIKAVKNAKETIVTPAMDRKISGRSRTRTKEALFSLISSYRSYPKYRNEDTLDAIYRGFEKNEIMDMPLVIKDGDYMRVMAGNTRMDVAFQLGINPKVLMIEV